MPLPSVLHHDPLCCNVRVTPGSRPIDQRVKCWKLLKEVETNSIDCKDVTPFDSAESMLDCERQPVTEFTVKLVKIRELGFKGA